MSLLEIKNLSAGYQGQPVLQDLNLSIQEGDFVLLLGENGSGKSTLLKCILEEIPYKGTIALFGQDKKKDLSRQAYVPQKKEDMGLAFPITCLELVTLGLYKDFGPFHRPGRASLERAKEILRKLGLEEEIHKPVRDLSGGQRQRAYIARALVGDPDLILFDEPSVGLDQDHLQDFKDILERLHKKEKKTILLISHDPIFQDLDGVKTYLLDQGRICHV